MLHVDIGCQHFLLLSQEASKKKTEEGGMKMNGLKYIRTRCNLSLAELGDYIGVSRQTISSWENGTRGISKSNKSKLEAFFGIDGKYFQEISDEDKFEILTKPMFGYTDGEKKYYKYIPENENANYEFLPEMEKSIDDAFADAIALKKAVLGKIDNYIMHQEASCAVVKVDMIRSNLWYFDHMLSFLEKKNELACGCKLPYRHEFRALMQILLVAYELEPLENLKTIRNHYDFEEEDLLWAENLRKEINEHWKRKESRNLAHISETEGALKQSIKKSIEESSAMNEAELLSKAQEDRKKYDPEGKTYSASLLGMKSGITSSRIKRTIRKSDGS